RRQFPFERGIVLRSQQVHHGSEILDATVHLRPHADFTFQLVFLTRGVLCGAAIRPKIGFAHAVFEGLDLRLQRGKVKDASANLRTGCGAPSYGLSDHRAWGLLSIGALGAGRQTRASSVSIPQPYANTSP